MKLTMTALAGAVTLAFAQIAGAQTVSPNVSVDQNGVQNSQQYGSGNQSSQTYGNNNQGSNTYQNGAQNQNATGNSAQQSQQYGKGNASSQGGTSAYEQNRQSNMPYSQQGAQNQNSYGSGNQQSQQYGQNNRSDQYGASGGQTRDRDDERHDKGKHKGQYKHDNDRHARGDDDRGHSGRE